MVNTIFGKKLGMTRYFLAEGECIPVTIVKVEPCVVIQKKTSKKDGYEAIQVGFEEKKESIEPVSTRRPRLTQRILRIFTEGTQPTPKANFMILGCGDTSQNGSDKYFSQIARIQETFLG